MVKGDHNSSAHSCAELRPLVDDLCGIITMICKENCALPLNPNFDNHGPFMTTLIVNVSISKLAIKCQKMLKLSAIELVYACMYVLEVNFTHKIPIHGLNVYNVMAVSILMTCKIMRDDIDSNCTLASIFHIELGLLNELEICFLKTFSHSVHLSVAAVSHFMQLVSKNTTCPILFDMIAQIGAISVTGKQAPF
jgi:hypothetical protein